MDNNGSRVPEGLASRWDDPKISWTLVILTYIIGGAGIALGIYGYADDGAVQGIHYAVPLMVGAVGVLSFVRHSVFRGSDARRMGTTSGDPYFQLEVGFANGGIGLLALIAFFLDWGVAAEASLTLAYASYLAMGFLLFTADKVKSGGIDGGIIMRAGFWLLQVGFMFFFGIAAAVSAGL
ncbi:MAG: DUF6790 family protein [Actinomycetota bacterium]|nr:DUF6790 family protein [Actinomycetota bacterium]